MSTDPARSAARAADALEHVNDALIVVDRAWTIEYANAVATELVEHDADDMVGLSFWDIFPDERRDEHLADGLERLGKVLEHVSLATDAACRETIAALGGPRRGDDICVIALRRSS